MAVSLLGAHDVGPVVIVQRTPPAAIATPAFTIGSDLFRCVIRGSSRRHGRQISMGDARFQAGGASWDEVVAGPDGLDEVIVVGDRRGRIEVDGLDGSGWADTITSTQAELVSRLAAVPA
jgi:hypothetical protein